MNRRSNKIDINFVGDLRINEDNNGICFGVEQINPLCVAYVSIGLVTRN